MAHLLTLKKFFWKTNILLVEYARLYQIPKVFPVKRQKKWPNSSNLISKKDLFCTGGKSLELNNDVIFKSPKIWDPIIHS